MIISRGPTIPALSTELGLKAVVGRCRVRLGIGRGRYRVTPGLYRVGAPDARAPVLVTANYRLTVDMLRSKLADVDAWILVLDTEGVNVWCAAGKGSFGTEELVRKVRETDLSDYVAHRKLVVPQLGATGVSAHEVRRLCGFKVIFGPVRAEDIPAFLGSGMRATDEMRRVTFTMGDRIEVASVEIVGALKWILPILVMLALLAGGESVEDRVVTALLMSVPLMAGAFAGTLLVPVFLPWIPGRAFSLKGALAGGIAVGLSLALIPGVEGWSLNLLFFLLGTMIASFLAMQFTGSTTFTSPSGVEWEMKRALPCQIGGVVIAVGIGIVRWLGG